MRLVPLLLLLLLLLLLRRRRRRLAPLRVQEGAMGLSGKRVRATPFFLTRASAACALLADKSSIDQQQLTLAVDVDWESQVSSDCVVRESDHPT
jgi:hypothetical protein